MVSTSVNANGTAPLFDAEPYPRIKQPTRQWSPQHRRIEKLAEWLVCRQYRVLLEKVRQVFAPYIQVERACPSNGFRSEEHTSELQSRENLVCRLLLEKKN